MVELNAPGDNPLVVPEDEAVISNGNFHSGRLALHFDALAVALCQQATMAANRIMRLMSPHHTSFPRYLTPRPGVNCGFATLQKTFVGLVAEVRHLANPGSPISTVSMTGGTLRNFANASIATLTGTGTILGGRNGGSNAILTVGGSADSTYSGVIDNGTGTLALVKQGSGTLILAGDSLYTGGTTVQSGLLLTNTNFSNGTITITGTPNFSDANNVYTVTISSKHDGIAGTPVNFNWAIGPAPATFSRSVTVESLSGTRSARMRELAVVLTPAVS